MSDNTNNSEKIQLNEQTVGLYPDLAHYFAIFDPDSLEVFPPPSYKENTAEQNAHGGRSGIRLLLRVSALLIISAVIVIAFILIGISTIPKIS